MHIPNLTGKLSLVTGAGSGIGAAATVSLARSGARVLAAVKPGTAQELSLQFSDLKERITVIECDIRKSDDVQHLLKVTLDSHDQLDVLVNNAGVVQPIGHIADLNIEEWVDCFAVNTIGAFRCTQAFLPSLLKAKGTIINISSGAAYKPLEGWSAYCSSKAALVMLSRVTAHEYSERGIRTFSLSVEPTDTEMQAIIRNSEMNPISAIPRDRLVPASKIASAILWLCSPSAQVLKNVEIDVRDPLFAYLLNDHRDSQ